MGRRDGLSTEPKTQQKPVQQDVDIKTKADIRGIKPTGLILDQMRHLAMPTEHDQVAGKKPK